ncbi:MAG: hemolysin family protein [Actinobacteria bacterium]|nr:hemolysin family protein [Actinomycetota bacterium]MBW3642730.1 hemolysin family protein [Actinomycetota bacterium]
MELIGPELVLVVLLILINAAFAGSEIALVSLREGQIRQLDQQGERGHTLAKLARDPNQFLATIQVGITLAGFLASAAAASSYASALAEPLGFLGAAAQPVALILVTLVLTYFTLVLGELAPKRVALQRAERWALVAARPLALLSRLSRPAVWLLSRSTDLAVRALGVDPNAQREEITEEEVRDLVATQSAFSSDQRGLLAGVFELDDRTLRQVLVPRLDVVAFDQDQPAPDVLAELVRTGHSRAPVHEGDLDRVVGWVHVRDLVGSDQPVGSVARPALVLPETARVLDALRRLQTDRQQLAVVVSEHGGVEGLVTMEDIVEEIVGEIYDEFDHDLGEVRRDEQGGLVLAGSFPIHDLADLDVGLPEGEYTTVAGLVLDHLGHIPEAGESVEIDGWRIEVVEMKGRAIAQIRLAHLGS